MNIFNGKKKPEIKIEEVKAVENTVEKTSLYARLKKETKKVVNEIKEDQDVKAIRTAIYNKADQIDKKVGFSEVAKDIRDEAEAGIKKVKEWVKS